MQANQYLFIFKRIYDGFATTVFNPLSRSQNRHPSRHRLRWSRRKQSRRGKAGTAKRPPEGLGLALTAACVTLAGKTAGGEEFVPLELARRFCGVIW
ncbi:hypothetical protein LF599_12060 [Pseudodesulfovibrio thermohalotolerans]|uniref:hypothetical protein n=1 Tax=Pseudodesulfovibrio thermohalotolerans TaxID=2880651 RepID=UPI00244255D8|nr:hypothetical protein [Pseudodesulfovibrio thermohalotolerans]WFS61401.1 hypothetical protein LF599_12060 [Pseudodesulfovibrio thermohalotolerans]